MRHYLSIFLFSFLCFSASANEWKGPFDYSDFPEIFPGGNKPNDEIIYIAMVLQNNISMEGVKFSQNAQGYLKEISIKNTTWVFGQLSKQDRGVKYSFDGKDNYAPKYIMFTPSNPKEYRWKKASDGVVPPKAVKAWGEQNDQYLCRADWAGGWLIGRLLPAKQTCLFSYGGSERAVFVYEVLVSTI